MTASVLLASLEPGENSLFVETLWMSTRSIWYRFVPTSSGVVSFGATSYTRYHVNVFADKNGTLAGASLVSTHGRASVTKSAVYAVQVVLAAQPWSLYGSVVMDPTVTINWALGGTAASPSPCTLAGMGWGEEVSTRQHDSDHSGLCMKDVYSSWDRVCACVRIMLILGSAAC